MCVCVCVCVIGALVCFSDKTCSDLLSAVWIIWESSNRVELFLVNVATFRYQSLHNIQFSSLIASSEICLREQISVIVTE